MVRVGMFSTEGRPCQCLTVTFAFELFVRSLSQIIFPSFILPGKPAQPANVTVEEVQSNATECHVQNRLVWGPTTDDGDTPITSYIVEYKHTVFNMILISETVSGRTEHVICKLQASGYPRELHVYVRAINKVGHGSRSLAVPVSFFSEFVRLIFSCCNRTAF